MARRWRPARYLDSLVQLDVVLRHKCKRAAGPSGASRPTDTMDVVLGVPWDLKVDNDVHRGDVKASALRHSSNSSPASAHRLATSVAIKMLRCPALNLFRAAIRLFCVIFP